MYHQVMLSIVLCAFTKAQYTKWKTIYYLSITHQRQDHLQSCLTFFFLFAVCLFGLFFFVGFFLHGIYVKVMHKKS